MVCRGGETQTVIIFDWDDTICPSSFVDRAQIDHVSDLPEKFQKIFTEVARCAEKCLYEAAKHGEVIIITNSDDGWVKYSCERFVPRLLPVLDKYRIVSARTRYERFYPSQPLCWKAAAFAHEVNEVFESYGSRAVDGTDDSDTASSRSLESTDVSTDSGSDQDSKVAKKEIISFGDSMEERTSVRIVAEQLGATPKSVMFVSSPTPSQLIGQLHMLTTHMKSVCDHCSSLDMEISEEQAGRCAVTYLKRHKIQDNVLADDLAKMLLEQVNSVEESI